HRAKVGRSRQAPCAERMPFEIEMPAVAIAAVEADVEPVAAHDRRQAIDARDADARQRNRLVEELYARLAAELAAVADCALGRAERIHPEPDGERDREQEKPGAEHRRSVNTVAFGGKPGRDRAPVLAPGVLVTIAAGLAKLPTGGSDEADFSEWRACDRDAR